MCTCVRFNDNSGNMYFGRNLDWDEGYGQKIIITPREYKYCSEFLGKMNTKHAVIGMAIAIHDKPLYFDCANDAGLGIAGLNFPGYAKFEDAPVDGKTNIAAYEFPLWVAMNFSSVDEVKSTLSDVAIVAKPVSEEYPVSMLHWMIGDGKESIVVESTKDGLLVFQNDVDVLSNAPGFKEHLAAYRSYTGDVAGGYTSGPRFLRAAYLNHNYPMQDGEDANIVRLFRTLGGVGIVDGALRMDNGHFEKTIYTSGYSALTRTYYYNTYEDFTIKKVALKDFDLDSAKLIFV